MIKITSCQLVTKDVASRLSGRQGAIANVNQVFVFLAHDATAEGVDVGSSSRRVVFNMVSHVLAVRRRVCDRIADCKTVYMACDETAYLNIRYGDLGPAG